MSIGKEYRIKITEEGMGLTQALKKFIEENPNSILEDDDGKITLKEWNATMDKLIAINEKRLAEDKESIFTGGTDKTKAGWQNSFIVHKDAEIVFSEAEMVELFGAMGLKLNTSKGDTSKNELGDDNRAGDALQVKTDTTGTKPPVAPSDSTKADGNKPKSPALSAQMPVEDSDGRYSFMVGGYQNKGKAIAILFKDIKTSMENDKAQNADDFVSELEEDHISNILHNYWRP